MRSLRQGALSFLAAAGCDRPCHPGERVRRLRTDLSRPGRPNGLRVLRPLPGLLQRRHARPAFLETAAINADLPCQASDERDLLAHAGDGIPATAQALALARAFNDEIGRASCRE